MKNVDFDKGWLGGLLGLATPFVAFLIYYRIYYSFMSIYKFIDYLKLGQIFPSVLSLCVLCNLIVFYPFLWKEKYFGARGVLASTFIWGGIIVYVKYFSE